ncbi:MAG: integrin alpha [Planctomycetota bacterium]
MRHICVLFSVLGFAAALSAQPALYRFDGPLTGSQQGTSVAILGDINGDGFADVLAGAPKERRGTRQRTGTARAFSGADGTPLFAFQGSVAFDQLGHSVAAIGDFDGDGVPDAVIGMPGDDTAGTDVGRAILVSGASGTVVGSLLGVTLRGEFGTAVAGAGDVNGDGYADIIVGAPLSNVTGANVGEAMVFSGVDQALLYSIAGSGADDFLGTSVAGLGDVNGDGLGDFAVGAPKDDNVAINGGSVVVYSGADGLPLYTIDGANDGDELGTSVAGLGDTDGDGVPDFVVGVPFEDGAGVDAGLVEVRSGVDGSLLWAARGNTDAARMGFSVGPAGDFDLDGFADVVVGSPWDATIDSRAGGIFLFSGNTGCLLHLRYGDNKDDQYGHSVAGGGDVDGDGFIDLVAGAPGADFSFPAAGTAMVLRVPPRDGFENVITHAPGTPNARFGFSIKPFVDVDGDLVPEYLVGAPFDGPNREGSVRIYSGATHTEIHQFVGPGIGDSWFGHTIDNAGDVDQDGFDDIIVGAYHWDVDPETSTITDEGRVEVFSGNPATSFSSIYLLQGTTSRAHLGSSVGGLGDVDGDTVPDFFAAQGLDAGEVGNVQVYSGATGSPILPLNFTGTLAPEPQKEWFGWSAASVGDLDGDGVSELAVGAPSGQVEPTPGSGYVNIYSLGQGGALLHRFDGPSVQSLFGWSVASAGDVNNDGTPDIIIGGYLHDRPGIVDCGIARVYSGVDFAPLHTLFGNFPDERYGNVVHGAGDVDGDNHDDFFVGAPQSPACGLVNAGAVTLYSGRTGQPMQRFEGTGLIDLYRIGAGIGDLNGDGKSEFAIAGDWAPVTSLAGRVEVYQTGPYSPARFNTFGPPCPGSDGRLPRIGAADRAIVGGTFTTTLGTAPASVPAVWNFGSGPPSPLPLAGIGAPGCELQFLPVGVVLIATDPSGNVAFPAPLPDDPAFLGGVFLVQWGVVDVAANPLGVIFSDAGAATIGSF